MSEKPFRFKQFTVEQDRCAMKIGTDGVLLGAWAQVEGAKRVLDIGTGTGLIALMMAQRNSECFIHAIEIDVAAGLQARENVKRSPWSDRIEVVVAPAMDFGNESDLKFDLIVSNPPFFKAGVGETTSSRLKARHADSLPHEDLIEIAKRMLAESGRMCLVLPVEEGRRFRTLARFAGVFVHKIIEVRPRPGRPVKRLLMEFGKERTETELGEMIIQVGGANEYSEEYIELVKGFYLDM